MNKNVPVQTYLPPHLAAWLEVEARKAKVSRSHWLASVLTDLFQGQDVREEGRTQTRQMLRKLEFIGCALDGLLVAHPDPKLREQVVDAFHDRLEREQLDGGE